MAVQVLGKVAYFNKGAYNSQTNYEINDVVSYNGSSYVSLNDNNQGNLPTNTNYWSVVAEKGDKGDTGKPFVIEKTYSSIESMVADYDNMNVNDYVMIQGSIEEQENATLWTKREVEVSPYKWAYLADFSGASGITGATPNIHIGTVTEGNEPSVTRRSGSSNENPILDFVLKTGAKGETGATGNGISSIEKISTSGLVDTYTITFTNGTSTTIEVTNGRGIISIAKTGTVDYVDTYTITYNDGTTSTFDVTNGEVTEEEFNDVVDELNYLYDDLPKVEEEGTNLTLDNTRKGKMSNVLKGNDLDQYTTTGKNKLNSLSNYSAGSTRTSNGVTYLFNSDGSISINGTATGTSFAILIGNNLNDYETERFIINEDYIVGNWDNSNITLMARGTDGIYRTIYKGNNSSTGVVDIKNIPLGVVYIEIASGSIVNETIYPQIELGNIQTSYEKFTGGNPAPNPDYPQDVHVVSGNNTIKVEGKNLFDKNNANILNGYISANGTLNIFSYTTADKMIYIPCKPNTTYTCQKMVQGTQNKNRFRLGTTANVPQNANVLNDFWYMIDGGSDTSHSITTGNDANYLVMYCYNGTDEATSFEQMLNSIQIEKGSTATTYQPYESQTYPINLGVMELCKIGDYQDYIYKDNGKWYKHSEIGKRTFDGSENWTIGNRTYLLNDFDAKPINNIDVQMAYNNHFFWGNGQSNVFVYGSFWYTLAGTGLRFEKDATPNLTDFKNWLSSNNVTVYYVLATSTNTEITDQTLTAQLDDFEKAISYNNQTNISQENNDKPFIISASAYISLKYLFNNLDSRVTTLES